MRRTEKEFKKLRLKIIELKKEGLTYEGIRRKTGASPNTIAKILKNFSGRYCVKCGETNPAVLHGHHPDKENRPDYTITLCANCHNEIHRGKNKETTQEKKESNEQISNNNQALENKKFSTQILKNPEPLNTQTSIAPNFTNISWEDHRDATIIASGITGILYGLFCKELGVVKRVLLSIGGLILVREGIKNMRQR